MFVEWFVLVLVVLGFALVLRDNVHADRRIDELMIRRKDLLYVYCMFVISENAKLSIYK